MPEPGWIKISTAAEQMDGLLQANARQAASIGRLQNERGAMLELLAEIYQHGPLPGGKDVYLKMNEVLSNAGYPV